MGNRLSRRRYAPAETAAAEHKPSVEQASSKAAEDSAQAQTQEIDQPGSRGPPEEPERSDACLTEEKECEEVETPTLAVHDTLMEPQELTEPNPVAEVHPAPEPVPDPSFLETDPEESSEPSPETEPSPTETLEEADLVTQELLPESPSPPTLIVPDVTPIPVLTLSGPSEASAGQGTDGEATAVELFPAEPEASTEMSEFLDELTKVEAAESMGTLGSDVIESVGEILKNSELKGNDLLNDLIPGDVNIYDDTPISGQLI